MVKKTNKNIKYSSPMYKKYQITIQLLVIIIPLIVFQTNSYGEILPDTITISPMLGKYSFEGNQNVTGGTYFNLGTGYDITPNWGIEFSTRLARFEINYCNPITMSCYTDDTDSIIFQFNTLYYLNTDELIVPYVFGGIGNMYMDTHNNHLGNHNISFGNYGLGAKYKISDNIHLRSELCHILTFGNSNFDLSYDFNHNLAFTFGLTFTFNLGQKRQVLSDNDADTDGVPDHIDNCPDTISGLLVDETGCSIDNDSDGIDDYKDKCPGTQEGSPVDSRGCPLDSDGDGLFDYEDKCPGTKENARVDANGCPIKKSFKKIRFDLNINFNTNETALKPEHHKNIKRLAYFLRKYPDSKAIIESYTDSIGPAGHNLELSQKRAENIVYFLVKSLKISASRLEPVGYGETRPIADDSTDAGRMKNRRIIAVVTLPNNN